MFGLSKLYTILIGGGIAIAIAVGLYFLILQKGQDQVKTQVQAHNTQVVEKAREADDKAITQLIERTRIIDNSTHEVKEVVHEVTPTSINAVSLARLERVRTQQQKSVSENSGASISNTTDVSNGTSGPGN